jgi:enterochelin esterase-like enzyme
MLPQLLAALVLATANAPSADGAATAAPPPPSGAAAPLSPAGAAAPLSPAGAAVPLSPAPFDAASSAADGSAATPAPVGNRGSLGPSVPIDSPQLGYAVNVRVYEPPSVATCESLPVLYVTDGSDYWKPELGNIVDTLDELIAGGRIAPVVAVFIDAWDPVARKNRRFEQFLPAGPETHEPFDRCPFCDFVVEEVVPWVEARYPVDGSRRGILGTSLGGFNAAYMALTHPDLFRVVGIQSPSIWRQPWFAERVARAAAMPLKVAIDVGDAEEGFLPGARALRDAYSSRGVPLQYREAPADHSWKHWRATAGEVLLFLYPPR